MNRIFKVTEVNDYIKRIIDKDFILSHLTIEGEISNCKYHSSGHIYFSLKDCSSIISCVLFSSYARGMDIRLKDGMQVYITGSIRIYERAGLYQVYVREVKEKGLGQNYKDFLLLKEKLQKEGLFDIAHKKTIPYFSRKIGIITADTGAAIKDIVNVAKRRNPYVQLILYPSRVQGKEASKKIIEGIEYFNNFDKPDCIIIARGGGSIEDLYAFNDEDLARVIYQSEIPIISGVGHESDYTISDFAADLRAATPSVAAELAVRPYLEIKQRVDEAGYTLGKLLLEKIKISRDILDRHKIHLDQYNPIRLVEDKRIHLSYMEERLRELTKKNFNKKKHGLDLLKEKLNGLSPFTRLSGGYSFIVDEYDKPIRTIKDIKKNDNLQAYLSDGILNLKVEGIEDWQI